MSRKLLVLVLVPLFFFVQSCMAWPMLTGAIGLAAGKKSGDSPFFLLPSNSAESSIVRIELTSQDSSIAKGTSSRIHVTAVLENGTNRDITSSSTIFSSSTSIATIEGNSVRGLNVGSSNLEADFQGFTSKLLITVTPALLASIQVTSSNLGTLAVGSSRQFFATGIFSDGSNQDLTNDSLTIWSSSNSSSVSVNASGLAKALSSGTVSIRASFGSKQGLFLVTASGVTLSSIQVTPSNPSIPLGANQQFTAIGIYSDNSTQDLTNSVTWTVLDTSISTIQNNGLSQSTEVGSTTVFATSGSVIGLSTLTVTSASLVSISISPVFSSAPNGLQTSFTATGILSDNSSFDITDQVSWTSTDTNILTISNAFGSHGLGSSLKPGRVTITASIGGIEGYTDFTVTPTELISISVSPIHSSKAKGLTEQFLAIGIYTDHTTQDITNSVTWTSSSSIVSVSNLVGTGGLAQTLSPGSSIITATLGNISGNTNFTVTSAILTSIQVSPSNSSLAKGTTKNFSAIGIYSDSSNADISSSVTWSSSAPLVSSISNASGNEGLAFGNEIGITFIQATLGNVTSASVNLSVTAAELVSIGITPSSATIANGLTQNFTATGVFTDNSTQNITEQVTWFSSDTIIAQISNVSGNKGITNALVPGSSEITAVFGSVSSPAISLIVSPAELVSISVTPIGLSIAKGFSQQFDAVGTYTDNTTQNITNSATWSSSNPSKVQISNASGSLGLASTLDTGLVTITATSGSISGSSNLTVSSAVLTSIQVTPTNPSVAKGLAKQFTATGIYSDNSTQNLTSIVTWSSSDSSKVLIENTSGTEGLASANSLGNSNISAVYNSFQSNVSVMSVTPAELVNIVITPPAPSKAKGLTQQFAATGIFTDSSSQDLTQSATWYSSNPGVAQISNASGSIGLAMALSSGLSEIYAVYGSRNSNTVSFTVNPAELVSIQISPVHSSLAKGLSRQFYALGIYSDASTQDITSTVSWSDSDPLVASISNATGTKGMLNALQTGTNTVTATLGSISASTDLMVTPATLSTIAVSPTNPTINATLTKQFTAVGTYSDASFVDLTSLVTWSSSNTSTATVSNATGTQGLATGVNGGSSIITAIYNSVSGNTTLTVNSIDTISPTITSVASLSPTTIRIVYSENVNNAEALNLSNYKVVNSASLTGSCSDNSDFSANSQTSDFALNGISGSGSTFTITLSSSQLSGKTYTLMANRNGIHDLSLVPNLLGCPNNADFSGLEQLKVTGAVCNTVGRVILSFSKSVYPGADIAKSAECSNSTQCALRYKFTGVSSLGNITSAKLLDGSICGGAPPDASKVCLTHSLSQSGGQYTVIAANNLSGDGFDDMAWGAIRDTSDTENLQSSPKDRTSFIGCGSSPVNFSDGPIASNPFADDSSFGYLTVYNGRIYIGPNTNGNQAVRFNYDGTQPESVSFSFTKDTTFSGGSNVSSNSASSRDGGIGVPPYVTIGHTGCSVNNANQATGCGPDNEDGRGVFSTGSLGGTEHILMAGSRSSENFNYLYYSSDTDSGLDFKYIDMGSITGTVTAGTSAITVMNDRIFSGFAKRNQSTNSPDFGKITFNFSDASKCTIGSNCNANDGTRGDRFRIDRMPYFGGGSAEGNNSHINWAYYVGIDSLFVFNGRIYAANGGFPNASHNGSIIRSTNDNPSPCDNLDSCLNWTDVAPRNDSKWHNGSNNNWFSLELTKYYDLIPGDKAFSQFAEFNGKLYVTRTVCVTPQDNSGLRSSVQTISGCTNGNFDNRRPQLWKCDPSLTGNTSNCDVGDWSLVGDDGTGFTNFGNTSNHSITMAVRNGSYLYIGFDNESGVQIWRTNIQNPGSSSSSWEQIGASGLGDTNNRQIYSSISGTDAGVNYIYVSVGKNNQPVRVYRQQNN